MTAQFIRLVDADGRRLGSMALDLDDLGSLSAVVHSDRHGSTPSSVDGASEGTAGPGPGGLAPPYSTSQREQWRELPTLTISDPVPERRQAPEHAWSPAVVMIDLDEVHELDHHLVVAMNACRQRGRHRTVRVLEQILDKVRPSRADRLRAGMPVEATPPIQWTFLDEHGTHPQWTLLDTRPIIEQLQRDITEAVDRALRGEQS